MSNKMFNEFNTKRILAQKLLNKEISSRELSEKQKK